jgi:hypothetical protein
MFLRSVKTMQPKHLRALLGVATALVILVSAVTVARRSDASDPPIDTIGSNHLLASVAPNEPKATHHKLNVTVDGSKTPHLIPDDYAYHHLLAATAISGSHTPGQLLWIRARIKRIGFSEFDAARFEATLSGIGLGDELRRISKERVALSARARDGDPIAAKKLRELHDWQQQLIRDAKTRVIAALSPEGVALFKEHIRDTVKRHVKILSAEMNHTGGEHATNDTH